MKRLIGIIVFIVLALVWVLMIDQRPNRNQSNLDESGDSLAGTQLTQGTQGASGQPSESDADSMPEKLAINDLNSTKVPLPLSHETKQIILSCIIGQSSLSGVSKTSEFNSLSEFLEKALTPHGGQEALSRVELLNVHVQSFSGETLRLHLTPQEGGKTLTGGMRIRLFGVDQENLPEPMPLPEYAASKNWEDALEAFKAQGKLIFEEKVESKRWGKDLGARVTTRNGEVPEMELHFSNRHLLCATKEDFVTVVCRCF